MVGFCNIFYPIRPTERLKSRKVKKDQIILSAGFERYRELTNQQTAFITLMFFSQNLCVEEFFSAVIFIYFLTSNVVPKSRLVR